MVKRLLVIAVAVVVALSMVQVIEARKKRGRKLNDKGIPIVEKRVCTELCGANERIYVYDGVLDPAQCARIGGEMYSHHGYELIVVCKVMYKKRCKQQEGELGEFHFPFNPKNYTHLGCTENMKPEECRQFLREAYASKSTPNKYFMNNIGCLVH